MHPRHRGLPLCIEPDEENNAFYLRLTSNCNEWDGTGDPLRADFGHAAAKETIAVMLLAIANDIEQYYRLDEREKLARVKRTLRTPQD